ncbi:alpha/beta hydrolase [Paenibacillus polymyxa]|uniref:alpha/beta fold hydrolase n=1 Tax=Paenibacillus polymyxa TaxID=1406 RepID=UPI002ED0DCC5|nr:alpha/beta hydrolase [Paenibacillus polymyxa]
MLKELKELMPNFKDGFFTTSDGVEIHYLEGGSGEPLILTSGWPTSPCIFAYNLPEISKHYHVIAIETRGTGESGKPSHGYRVSRSAKDVYDMMQALGLKKAHFMGHSMGCSTLWAFIDLFGQNMIDKLILVDQSPWLWSDVGESDESMELHCGHRGNPYGLYDAYANSWADGNNAYGAPEYWPTGPASLAENRPTGDRVMELEGIMNERYQYQNKLLAGLLVNHYMTDWRDIIEIIDVPTLYITGETTHAMNAACIAWLKQAIKGVEMVVFSKEEYGNHIMMANSPEKFNRTVTEFLQK